MKIRVGFGWARVQALCDFVHNHIPFGYEHARVQRHGVCAPCAKRLSKASLGDLSCSIPIAWRYKAS